MAENTATVAFLWWKYKKYCVYISVCEYHCIESREAVSGCFFYILVFGHCYAGVVTIHSSCTIKGVTALHKQGGVIFDFQNPIKVPYDNMLFVLKW